MGWAGRVPGGGKGGQCVTVSFFIYSFIYWARGMKTVDDYWSTLTITARDGVSQGSFPALPSDSKA